MFASTLQPASPVRRRLLVVLSIVGFVASLLPGVTSPAPVLATHGLYPIPPSVNLAGDLESEATADACGDWDPSCAASAFSDGGNLVYRFDSAMIPAGSWGYKVGLGGWTENYGANFQQDGPNIVLTLAAPTSGPLLLRPQDPLHRRQRPEHDLHPARQLQRGDRLWRRLVARLPPDADERRGRRRRLHLHDRRHPGRELLLQGRHERELVQPELRRRWRLRGRAVLGSGQRLRRDVLVRQLDARPDRPESPRRRRGPTTTWNGTASDTTHATASIGLPAGRSRPAPR